VIVIEQKSARGDVSAPKCGEFAPVEVVNPPRNRTVAAQTITKCSF
jgi:hypothetical protein